MLNHPNTMLQTLLAAIVVAGVFLNHSASAADIPSQATTGDPARWYEENTTPTAVFRNSKKEDQAALKDAVVLCKELRRPEQASCLKAARSNYEQDLASARERNGVHEK